jgi:hypothetical protein
LPHSIRKKIAISVSTTKQRLRKERLAARAAAAAEAATADLRKVFSSSHDYEDGAVHEEEEEEQDQEQDQEQVLLDDFELERAAAELASLRSRLTGWMSGYETKYGRKPDLTEASETHPTIYALFVRYVALRDLVRRSSVAK